MADRTKRPLSDLMRESRARKGWSFQRAAEITGLSKSQLWQIEAGRLDDILYSTLVIVCKWYGIGITRVASICPGDGGEG